MMRPALLRRSLLAGSLLVLLSACASHAYQPGYLNGTVSLKEPVSLPLSTTLVRVRLIGDSAEADAPGRLLRRRFRRRQARTSPPRKQRLPRPQTEPPLPRQTTGLPQTSTARSHRKLPVETPTSSSRRSPSPRPLPLRTRAPGEPPLTRSDRSFPFRPMQAG